MFTLTHAPQKISQLLSQAAELTHYANQVLILADFSVVRALLIVLAAPAARSLRGLASLRICRRCARA